MLVVLLGAGVYLVGVKTNLRGMAGGSSGTLALPAQMSATVNQPFTVSVTLNAPAANVDGVDVRLLFDPSLLRLSQIDPIAATTTALATFVPLNTSNTFDASGVVASANQTGLVRFSALSFNAKTSAFNVPQVSSSSVILANLTFVPLKTGSGTVSFDFDSTKPQLTTDSNIILDGAAYTDSLVGVTNMAVVSSAPLVTSTPAPLPSPTPVLLTNSAIVNPGLETGNLAGWTASKAAISLVASDVHSGAAAAVLTGNSAKLSQNIAAKLTPGVAYTFSVWTNVKTLGTSWGFPTFRLSKYSDLGSADFGESKAANSTSAGWQQIKITRTFTASDLSGSVYLGLINFGFSGVESVDDFSLASGAVNSITPTIAVVTATPPPLPTPTLKPTPTPLPTAAPTPTSAAKSLTLTGDISNQDGTIFTTSPDWIGTGGTAASSYTALRFTGVALPPGANITSATLSVLSSSLQWLTLTYNLAAENSANSQPFSSSSLPSGRTLTSASLTHSDDVQWQASTWYNLENVAPLIQAVVSRPDWQSGNSVSLIAVGTGNVWGRKLISGAKLTINY